VLLDELDWVTYVGVKTGFFGTQPDSDPGGARPREGKAAPHKNCRVQGDDQARPHFGQDETVSAQLGDRMRTYFRMEPLHSSLAQEGSYPLDTQDVGRLGPN
jgi:hypothetical protein